MRSTLFCALLSVAGGDRSGTNVAVDAEKAGFSAMLKSPSKLPPKSPPAAAIICGLNGLEDVLATLPFLEC